MGNTIFGKIISGEIPSDFLYEDEHCVAINDIQPQAPVHVLVIPKREIPRLIDATPDDQALLGHLMLAAVKVAQQLGVAPQVCHRMIVSLRRNGSCGSCRRC